MHTLCLLSVLYVMEVFITQHAKMQRSDIPWKHCLIHLNMCNESVFIFQIIHFLRTRAHPVMLRQVPHTYLFFSHLILKIMMGWPLTGLHSVFILISVLQTPVLPPTITDQIRLWELERDRLQFTEGERAYFSVCASLGNILQFIGINGWQAFF